MTELFGTSTWQVNYFYFF